jgi:hypothetical protein
MNIGDALTFILQLGIVIYFALLPTLDCAARAF